MFRLDLCPGVRRSGSLFAQGAVGGCAAWPRIAEIAVVLVVVSPVGSTGNSFECLRASCGTFRLHRVVTVAARNNVPYRLGRGNDPCSEIEARMWCGPFLRSPLLSRGLGFGAPQHAPPECSAN